MAVGRKAYGRAPRGLLVVPRVADEEACTERDAEALRREADDRRIGLARARLVGAGDGVEEREEALLPRMRSASGRFVFVATAVFTPVPRSASSATGASGFGRMRPRWRSKRRAYAASISATVRSGMYVSRSASVPFP